MEVAVGIIIGILWVGGLLVSLLGIAYVDNRVDKVVKRLEAVEQQWKITSLKL